MSEKAGMRNPNGPRAKEVRAFKLEVLKLCKRYGTRIIVSDPDHARLAIANRLTKKELKQVNERNDEELLDAEDLTT